MTTPVLKSLRPDGWPDCINAGKAVVRFPNGTESGSWYSRPSDDGDKTAAYVRRDPAVLAALPEVQAMIRAETERCAKIADPPLMHRKGKPGLWRARRAAIAAAIREGRG